jgi:hypothetical protein
MKWLIILFLLMGPVKSRALTVYEAMTWDHPHGDLHGPVLDGLRDFTRELFHHPHHEHGCRPPSVPVPGALWLFLSSVAGLSVILRRR